MKTLLAVKLLTVLLQTGVDNVDAVQSLKPLIFQNYLTLGLSCFIFLVIMVAVLYGGVKVLGKIFGG